MKSKSLNKNFLLADIKYNWKHSKSGFLCLLVLNTVAAVIYVAITILNTSPWKSPMPPIDLTYKLQFLNFSFFLYLLFAFFMVLKLFHSLYSNQQRDLYQSLPIDQKTLILSRFCSISAAFFVSFLLQAAVLVLAKLFMTKENVTFRLSSVLLGLFITAVTAACAASVFIFCAAVSDRMDRYVYYAVGLMGLLPAGLILLLQAPQKHVAGFCLNDTLVGYLFPTANIGLISTGQGNQWVQLIGMTVSSLLFLWLSVTFGHSSTNQGSKTKKLSHIPVGLVQLGVQLFCVSFFSNLMYWLLLGGISFLKPLRENPVLSVALSLPFSFLLTLVAELLLSKKRRFKSALLQWAVVSLCAGIGAVVLQGGLFGYETKIPKLQEISSVTFSDNQNLGKNRNQTFLAFEEIDQNLVRQNTINRNLLAGRKNIELTAQESIEKVLRLHQSSLEFYHKKNTRDCNTSYTVTYHLKNGKSITRTLMYSNNTLDIKEGEEVPFFINFDYSSENELVAAYRTVVQMEEYVKAGNPVFLNPDSKIVALQISTDKTVTVTNADTMNAIMENLRQDMSSGAEPAKSGSVESSYRINLYYGRDGLPAEQEWNSLTLDKALKDYFTGRDDDSIFEFYYFNLPDSYKNTISQLQELGYGGREIETYAADNDSSAAYVSYSKFKIASTSSLSFSGVRPT